MTLSY
jgi:hypothetical protein